MEQEPLEAARERIVLELSNQFAQDRIQMEELDRRLELAYGAESITQLEALIADLRGLPPAPTGAASASPGADRWEPATSARQRQDPASRAPRWEPPRQVARRAPSQLPATHAQKRILGLLSDSRRRGSWVVPPEVEVVAVMASLTIDLRDAALTSREIEFDISVFMAQLTIIVPRGMRVVNDASAVLAENKVEEHVTGIDPDAPVLHITGWSFMAEVTVRD